MSEGTDGRPLWHEATVVMATEKGSIAERGLVHPHAPGLAITMHLFGTFDVTHVRSGKKVAGPYQRCALAQLVLAQMSKCLDWKQDAAGIAAQIAARKDEPVPFMGATVSSGGVQRPQTIGEFLRGTRDWLGFDEFPWEAPADRSEEHTSELQSHSFISYAVF